jgi:hypothetical protein
MRICNCFMCMLLFFSVNALAMDSYAPATGILSMDGVVDNGTQYNNVVIQIPGYTVQSEGSNSTPYPTPNTATYPPGAACQSGSVPGSWQAPVTLPLPSPNPETSSVSNPASVSGALTNAMTLVLLRHGEKALQMNGNTPAPGTTTPNVPENGNMCSIGQTRAQLLPATLSTLFGCPDYIIAPNPSELTGSANSFYVRPLATIEPTATTIGFPVYTPYGYTNTPWLAYDLLTNSVFTQTASTPNIAFIDWEHNNLINLTNYIVGAGGLTVNGLTVDPATQSAPFPLNGVSYYCQPIPAGWPSCDYDSIWVLQVHDGSHVCYLHFYENLNNAQYQTNCSNPAIVSGSNPTVAPHP